MDNLKTIKFGNVEFNTDSFPYKSKFDFMKAYRSDNFKFDKDKAWNVLRQYAPKPKRKSSE